MYSLAYVTTVAFKAIERQISASLNLLRITQQKN